MHRTVFHSATQFGSWFLKKFQKMHVFSPWYMQAPKFSTNPTQHFFQPLNYTFMWTSNFYWYEHVYTYRSRHEFQNILERKLCNGFGKLLLIYTYFDSTYRDIRHSLNSETIWWIPCNLSRDKFESLLRIYIICLCASKFLTSLDGSSQNTLYWKTLE